MDVHEARRLIQKRFPKMKIIGCGEYAKYFVFSLVGKKTKPGPDGKYFGNGWKVNRATGEITHFFPPKDGFEDFRNGKVVELKDI